MRQTRRSGLDASARTAFESKLGADLSAVRLIDDRTPHRGTLTREARAMTVGDTIFLRDGGQLDLRHRGDRRLLAHELTHVIQQRRGSSPGHAIASAVSAEAEARAVADAVSLGRPAEVRLGTRPGTAQSSPLSDELEHEYAQGGKGAVFDMLRRNGPMRASDPDVEAWATRTFGSNTRPDSMTDDRWLFDTLYVHGPEPMWPFTQLAERERRMHGNAWPREPGNIEARFSVGAGRTAIRAYYFPGTSSQRALVIGGVHGTERAGVEVVELLLEQLRDLGNPQPYYTVIVVPELFPTNVAHGRRNTKGGNGVDPNRQFPAPGTTLSDARAAGKAKGKGGPVDAEDRVIEPENVVLLDLLERLRPHRICSVHGHSRSISTIKPGKGGASITVDPRSGATNEAADDALALEMAKKAKAGGARVPANFIGERGETTRYPTSTEPHQKGVTLGGYGPVETSARPAATTILVETYKNYRSSQRKGKARAERKAELMTLATVIREIFLARP